ncbi:hypothetical protein LI811_002119 [Salmonella enterica]|nr:hypothetical protein [Salmonella enterica]
MNWSLSFVPLMCAAGIVAIAFNGGLIGGHGACSDIEIYRFRRLLHVSFFQTDDRNTHI